MVIGKIAGINRQRLKYLDSFYASWADNVSLAQLNNGFESLQTDCWRNGVNDDAAP